jgi:hypothetical protein
MVRQKGTRVVTPKKTKSVQWKEKEEVKHFHPSQPATNATNQQGHHNPFAVQDHSIQ